MIDGFNTAMLIACFGMWYISRVFMAVVICLGPFLIIGALFKGTRGFVFQWIGKLIGLTMLGLASSIVLRVVLAIISARLRSVEINPSMSIDEMIVTDLVRNPGMVSNETSYGAWRFHHIVFQRCVRCLPILSESFEKLGQPRLSSQSATRSEHRY